MLEVLLEEMKKLLDEQPYLEKMYSALFMTTYFGLFRIGEVTLGPHGMKAKDINIATNKRKLMIVLHSSKTHSQGNHPQVIKVSAENSTQVHISQRLHHTCPFATLREFITVHKGFDKINEQFFVFRDGSPVTPSHMQDMLKLLLIKTGFNDSVYTVHGIRGGRAYDLLCLGVSVETIKKLGHWKFNVVFTYLQHL